VDDYTQKLLDGNEPEESPTTEQLLKSREQLHHLEKELSGKGQYIDAKYAANHYDRLCLISRERDNFVTHKTSIEEMVRKRNELLEFAQIVQSEWDQKIEAYKQQIEQHLQDMQAEHEKELQDFMNNVPRELPTLYKRNSVAYLELRAKERGLAFHRRYDEADAYQHSADVLFEQEKEMNYEKVDSIYREKLRRLRRHQKRELEIYQLSTESKMTEMINSREKQIRGAFDRARRLDMQIDRYCDNCGVKQAQIDMNYVDNNRVNLVISQERTRMLPIRTQPIHTRQSFPVKKPKKSNQIRV
jgi:hypothetical protein